jgi:hypothetical protein
MGAWDKLNSAKPNFIYRCSPTTLPATCRMEHERPDMQDLVMLLFTVIFFALAFLYVKACQKLR